MSTEKETVDHLKQSAIATAENIVEMVANLERETAAQFFVKDFDVEKCVAILRADDEEFIADMAELTVEDLREKIADKLNNESIEVDGFEFDQEEAQQRIQEYPLSVEVRSDWHTPGDDSGSKPAEFNILLGTGGPACRILGELNEHGEPTHAWIEYQDWGTPWTQLFNSPCEQETLLTYCRQFFFGE